MQIIDTHCHIHDSEFAKRYNVSQEDLLTSARADGVEQIIMIGTDVESSRQAVEFSRTHDGCYAALAIHPHEAKDLPTVQSINDAMRELQGLYDPKSNIVAIGECGLDYYYHSDSEVFERQKAMLRSHIELAQELGLPMSFHIRNGKDELPNHHTIGSAFADFLAILDEYEGITGVVHSFSAGRAELEACLERGLHIGLNGIMTFTKDQEQLAAAKVAPLEKIVLETDAPFLTPVPFRGKMCEPKHVRVTAEFLANLRGEDMAEFVKTTSQNAKTLFKL